jgi:phosphatidylserine/phosphatidylglycerophosphate/cardiolipin synthase-like enzyme
MARTRPILAPGHNVWRTAVADGSGVLVDADDYYRAFYESARSARRYLLMSGWQYDSGVPVLRGPDAPADTELRFLPFLNGLCEANPELHVYILAWDFHVVLALERQWMQRVYFHWMTNPRFRFVFDDCPVAGGSHHQKFVVVDGTHAYLGGMDVCEGRWDDRCHRGDNPLRTSRGARHKPYHDVQAFLTGSDVTAVLEDLFWDRWQCAGGGDRPALSPVAVPPPRPRNLVALGPAPVAFSRTQPSAEGDGIREVERLFVDAIAAAERLVFAETQYFSSRRIRDALIERMARADGAPLEIVVLVNERAEALKEELAVGLRQAQNLERLREAVAGTRHRLGLYFSVCDGPTDQFRDTYLHSKVLAVDDRFLTVGSANLTNRSMGIDSELHVSWETTGDDREARRLVRAIRRVRVSLLAEHGGLSGVRTVRALARTAGLVARLDALTAHPGARLQRHGPPTPIQAVAMEVIDPESLPFDPDTSPERPDHEPTDESHGVLAPVAGTITALRAYLRDRTE